MRDPERQNIHGNKFTVSYPDFPGFTRSPRYITMTQEMGHHDIVELYYQQVSPFILKALNTGVPVKIEWQNDKVKGTFIGYAVHATPYTAQRVERAVKITCVSASYLMKDKLSKIWTNATVSEVVTELATKYHLIPKVTSTSTRFSQISLAGHSVWEKMRELSHNIGHGLQVIGAELHFHPIDKMIDQFMTTIPVMAFLDPFTNPQSHFSTQTLSIFEADLGDFIETNPHTRSTKITAGVDPVTAKPHKTVTSPNAVGKNLRKVTKDPLFSSIETSVVSNSESVSKALAEGKAHSSRLSIPAKASGQGDPRIAPWATVEIRGTGELTDGFWVVKSATHTIHYDGRYTVNFTCLSDGLGSNKPSSTRPISAGKVPVVNLTSDTPKKPSTFRIAAKERLIVETQGGLKTASRKWVGVK
jgi:phage protein D